MLCTFFAEQLFQGMTVKLPSSELIITNMLEEVLLNCSARELKTDPKDKRIKFTHTKFFTTTFISLLQNDHKENRQESYYMEENDKDNLRKAY